MKARQAHQRVEALVDERLLRAGCVVDLDCLTWVPEDASGHEPLNAYVFLEDDRAVFIDTGPAIARPALEQAMDVVSNRATAVFPTRNEPDCIGNLGFVLGSASHPRLLFGGVGGILEWVNDPSVPQLEAKDFVGRVPIEPAENGTRSQIGSLHFRWFDAAVKEMWMTQWAYEASTKTLFTSDSFGFRHLRTPDEPVILEDTDELPEIDDVAREITCRINWLPGSSCDGVIARFASIFEELDVEIIAPVHGRILKGADVVTAHVELMIRALERATTFEPTFAVLDG